MGSTFTWLDYSDADRKRTMEVVDLLREEETRDELGLGVVRDAFSDRLFPGTSTIQTRLRYFLFIPWIFQRVATKGGDTDALKQRLRREQDALRQALVAGGEEVGVIGYKAGASVQRLPSSVYWHGLGAWHIRLFNGSEHDLYRRLARQAQASRVTRNDDGEPVGDAAVMWDPQLPAPPDDWLKACTFTLNHEERGYLEHRLRLAAGDSLLLHLVEHRVPLGESAFVWECPDLGDLPPRLSEELTNARNFAEVLHGAALLYNRMLAEAVQSDQLTVHYEGHLEEWWHLCRHRADDLRAWDRQRFWQLLAEWGARVKPPTRTFVDQWIDVFFAARTVRAITDSPDVRELIRRRELSLKGKRARLGSLRPRDLWNGASGSARLDYRWGRPVRRMIQDLTGEANA